ncbi:MAG: hypothetical protein ACRCZ0_09305 [Cetobacterium sp.]
MLNINAAQNNDNFYRYKMNPLKITICSRFNRTQLENFDQIAKDLERNPKTILKYISAKLGVKATTDKLKRTFISGTSFTREELQQVIYNFIDQKILCKYCYNPETEEKDKLLHCRACGKKSTLI